MADLRIVDVDGRISAPESKTREYKRDLSSPTKPLRTIVAFANSAGGQLVVGVADDGTVVGVADPLSEEERLASLIADSIEPQLVPAIDLVTLVDKTVLVVDVPLSTRRPHYIKSQGIAAGVYVRLGSTTRVADPALVAELERSARGIAFEDLPEPRASVTDLDLGALGELRRRATSRKDLIALGLAVKHGDKVVPTNAGLVVACDHPDDYMPSAWVLCGRLRGPNGTDIFDQVEIHGLLPHAVEQVMAFLTKHAYKTALFGEVRRRDVYSIPTEAIREVIINALVHASYAERGTPIRVAFHDDRIVVESPGLLMAGLTVDNLLGVSRLRNPDVARVFRDAGLIEQWGSGLPRVIEEVTAAGHGAPTIEEVVDRVRVTIPVQSHAIPGGSLSQSLSQSLSHEDVTMMKLMVTEPRTRAELLSAIGIRNETRNYERRVAPLIDAGLVERTIPDKPRSRDQKYRLTPAGRASLKATR